MKTKKAKFAERHNMMAAACLGIAKRNLSEGYPMTSEYFLTLAHDHQAMCHYYGY